MIKQYKASILFDTDKNHPDSKNAKGFLFTDIYRIDTDYFYDDDSIKNYIKNDLMLVAGGGYDSKHINNVTIAINNIGE